MLGVLYVMAFTLLAAAMASVAQYIFKKNLKKFRFNPREILEIVTQRRTFAGLVLYGFSFVIYIYALQNAPLVSFVYPIFSSSFVFILLISKYFLKEKMNTRRLVGMALIILGIGIISFTFPVAT